MDVDQDSLKYLQDLVRDVEDSAEAEHLLRLTLENHIECCDVPSLTKIAMHILTLCSKELEHDDDPFGG